MRLIDADKVKIESRKHCINCTLNGTKHCKTCVVNLICDRLDLQPTAFDENAYSQGYTQGTLDCRAAIRSENNGKK